MPASEQDNQYAIIRMVKTIIGNVHLQMECAPSFHYAQSSHIMKEEEKGYLFIPVHTEQTAVRLLSSVTISEKQNKAIADFHLKQGESSYFLLEAE